VGGGRGKEQKWDGMAVESTSYASAAIMKLTSCRNPGLLIAECLPLRRRGRQGPNNNETTDQTTTCHEGTTRQPTAAHPETTQPTTDSTEQEQGTAQQRKPKPQPPTTESKAIMKLVVLIT
jgi:hypothetical protein